MRQYDIIERTKIEQPKTGPTTGPYFWRLRLSCGHTINRSPSETPSRRARCNICENATHSPADSRVTRG